MHNMPSEQTTTLSLAQKLAKALLEIEAVILSPDHPFTWASGLKSPIYCDNRITLAYPELRRQIAAGFVSTLKALDLKPDVIVGTATAGIPHAAWVADLLDLPLAYVRSKPKAHGRRNQIEGRLHEGQQAVIIEDLISTGGSSIAAAQAVQNAGVEVQHVLAIFTYGLPLAEQRFISSGFSYAALTSFPTLVDVASASGVLSETARQHLLDWQADPAAWSAERNTQ